MRPPLPQTPSPLPPAPPSPRRRRRVWAISLALLVLVVVLFVPQAFKLPIQPSPESTWFLFLLSTVSFLAIVILTFVLLRQIVKLYAERRAQVLGARFKTKLVIGALALSLTPVVCMFGFTYGLINRTLDKWFSQPVESVRDDNQGMINLLTSYVRDNAQDEAASIAQGAQIALELRAREFAPVREALDRHRATLEQGFVVIFDSGGHALVSLDLPAGFRLPASAAEVTGASQLQVGSRLFMVAHAAVGDGDWIQVGMPVPASLSSQMARLARDRDHYDSLARQRRSLRLLYTGYLLLLTLAILFGATWMALYLSRLVTVPIAGLAAATQEISRGNLAYRVQVSAQDEIGALVGSFNRMAEELETNRAQIEASRRQLEEANHELESRRRYTEALLENTPSAVISLDRSYRIERVNPAVQRLFAHSHSHPRALEELFDPSSLTELEHLLRKSERWAAATGQIEVVAGGGRPLTLAVTVAAIAGLPPADPPPADGASPAAEPRRRRFAGYVLVLEDLTDLLRIQKTAAWREVAQRIAHEIKNPLTPIALSAQRIRRRLAAASAHPDSLLIGECAATIEAEVRSLQRLVDEFSAFARFPHAQPVPCDLNDVIERALRAFDGRLEGIEIRTRLDPLPRLRLDPDDLKRVFINLIDNAAEAMHASPYRQLTLATQLLDGAVEAVVADTGPGLPAADKQRLFLPYYSTKERGTGLGLAIVLRIVEENGGALRAEDNSPLGARFIIEFPLEETQPGCAANSQATAS